MSDNGDYEGGTRGETTHKQHQETRVASSAIKQLPYKDYAQLLRSARDALRHKRPGQCPSLLKHPSLSYAKRKPVVACTYVYYTFIPVGPHKAVVEISKIGNL